MSERFKGKRVAIVGSGPSVLENKKGFIDSHDLVVRVNNYKLSPAAGFRTDVHYSFYGVSIRKLRDDLINDGVTLCMCKLPNENFIETTWHARNNKLHGLDFKRVYQKRKDWWFCDTYVPIKERLIAYMDILEGHMPTSGFSCLLDISSFDCDIYLTGFDFFTSRIHNVDEPWKPANKRDPIRHRPALELAWLKSNLKKLDLRTDKAINELLV